MNMLVRALFARKLPRLPVDKLLQILSDGQAHTAGELAFQLGVSSRTVRRHLHMLRDERGLPIHLSRRGFILETEKQPLQKMNGTVPSPTISGSDVNVSLTSERA